MANERIRSDPVHTARSPELAGPDAGVTSPSDRCSFAAPVGR